MTETHEKNTMRFERVVSVGHPRYRDAIALYQISFPLHEQREALSQEQILDDSDYHFSLIYDEDTFVGLMLYWEWAEAIYVEHLCILTEMRNRQYGQKALALLSEMGKTVIVEIDPPVDEISIRRKGFYKRCGFVENPYPHVHPPYHRGTKGHDLVVMSYPEKLSPAEYDGFARYLTNRVMFEAFQIL